MDWTHLTTSERVALAALVRAMLRLDRSFSREESDRLREIAEELGDPEALWDAIAVAEREVTTPEALEAAARAVTRPEARAMILDVLESLAAAETVSDAEAKMLADLRALWRWPAD